MLKLLENPQQAEVAIIMGSRSDWPVMQDSAMLLNELSVRYQAGVVSAHRTPNRLYEFAQHAYEAGYKVVIAGAGGAAHLPGMTAAMTWLPVIGVPVATDKSMLRGEDALLSISQMPGGVPVATMSIGAAGAKNAALYAARILAIQDSHLRDRLEEWISRQASLVPETVED